MKRNTERNKKTRSDRNRRTNREIQGETKKTWREMREQEMKHGGTTREEKKWNQEKNKKTRSGTWRNDKRGEEMEQGEK